MPNGLTPTDQSLLLPNDFQQADLFDRRLRKLARHLRRWPTKRGITCFRVYEKDIPEIPLVVDRYEGYLHLTEYERPHDRSPNRHAAWLELMRLQAAESLEVQLPNAILKTRIKSEQANQYEKMANSGTLLPVQELGLTFLVNLTDYIDTGLFLDHRPLRKRMREEAKGKSVLNLFAYTGSFSVYAAAGGAKSTTTVDLSKNYLNWAQKNFQANQLPLDSHRFIASDTIEFLRRSVADQVQYDLVIVDPPTYSNSKSLENDWDVQRDHAQLLDLIGHVLAEAGVVYFSTNFRRFKLEQQRLQGVFRIREISQQTVPEDFRNRKIHRCWQLTKQSPAIVD